MAKIENPMVYTSPGGVVAIKGLSVAVPMMSYIFLLDPISHVPMSSPYY